MKYIDKAVLLIIFLVMVVSAFIVSPFMGLAVLCILLLGSFKK